MIRAPVSRGQLRAEVERRLPFDAEIAICVPATTRNWNTITAIRKVLDAGANLLVKNELAAGAASDPRRSHLPDRLDGDLAHHEEYPPTPVAEKRRLSRHLAVLDSRAHQYARQAMFTRFRSERGATFVHVGIILLGLIAFSGFAVDQGVLVVGRRQAQNLADAGAHAGAVARAFDDTSDDPPADSGIVYESVVSTVQQGAVWGEPIPTSAIVMSYECPPGKPGRCVRTDVHRDGTNGSTALPTFFMKLVGTMSQPVRATATAHVAPANGTRCLKPWMLPDKFLDPDKNGYDPGDTYDAPGYTLSDIGTQLVLHPPGGQGVQPSDYHIINEIGGSEGSPEYEANIVNCQLTGWIGKVMMDVQGTKNGPTNQGVRALIDEDPTATWNGTTVTGPLGLLSPRVVIIGLFNPEVYWTEKQQGNGDTFEIVNLMAMFIERVQGGEVTARIVGKAGDMVGNAGSPPDNAEFLSMIEFVR